MKVSLIQMDPVWEDPSQNREKAERLIRKASGADLVVLPEMFSTGFVTEPEGIAESDEDESLALMKKLSAELGCAIAGSIAVRERECGAYRNRFYFVKPDGTIAYYDKRHLFTYGGEHHHFKAGEKRVIVEHCGMRILLQVCYDLRFPVFSRNRRGEERYDMILYVASWPQTRIGAWDALLKARAIENQCYVAAVNRVGSDPFNVYCGHSVLIDPYGKILSECKENEEDTVVAEADIVLLEAFRKKFPVLEDSDTD